MKNSASLASTWRLLPSLQNSKGSECAPSASRGTPIPNTLESRLEEKERKLKRFADAKTPEGLPGKSFCLYKENAGPKAASLPQAAPGDTRFLCLQSSARRPHQRSKPWVEAKRSLPRPPVQYANPSTRK